MLQRLGRCLRAAGYDTLIATDAETDYYLLRKAIDEGRLLITCDRKLTEHRRAKDNVILLQCSTLEECAAKLCARIHIDWLHKPFTRCLLCNSLLSQATPDQLQSAPENIKASSEAVYYCPECRQVFWDGSHVRRMQDHLGAWQHKYTT